MVMILEKTFKLILQIYKYHKILSPEVSKVTIGLGYTGVELTAYAYEPFLGVAQTLPTIIQKHDCTKIDFAGKLTEKSFIELLTWALESPSLRKIIGVAGLNAASQHILAVNNPYTKLNTTLIEHLKVNKKTRIIFIGYIEPMIKKISSITNHIKIVDNNPLIKTFSNNLNIKNNIDQLNEQDLDVDVLICTGTSVLNNTLENILSIFKNIANYIVLIGPTVSFIPDILFDYGVDIIGGMKIINSEAASRIIQEGGGTRLFKKFGKKYYYIRS